MESYGLIAPGMPQTAADIGLHYARIAVSEEPLQATQYWTSLISLCAFHEGPLEDAMQLALGRRGPEELHGRSRGGCAPGVSRASRRLESRPPGAARKVAEAAPMERQLHAGQRRGRVPRPALRQRRLLPHAPICDGARLRRRLQRRHRRHGRGRSHPASNASRRCRNSRCPTAT